ncbi:biotin/lipoyl-binding carrier protein [Lactonifactor longoviformis]|uniref:biotin/lipoyl-binding carrier protein n=1 Tax=Lactonifactor TaxID=420345 RepID=UPI0012B067CE|nr:MULTISPECIES: biotin/lipoyl-binding carrier protein [Lactonifactor]MCB5714750.1 biotin/lipoyl-binding carrier protein [Lactonifactor longoviformis]MCB5718704.1 biotin/lipoyl-binding carrier protein [Lactonifactor longoviformis]MCQ4670450.1 biotin/lipoyl-binding carrier protein [Lactonifactor longoviformis]MSA01841.1 biotin/lipoyl-binding carrier protein [Lactonifactor sp. BIOML-A5]MSA08355.1 biotin/lipoyl-binding carrier protein [Lactonifactor sp. BIOML-A4]
MKNYTITVNGTAYDVTVEEGTGSAPAAPAAAPKAAPKAAPAAAPKKAAAGTAGAVEVKASVPGKVFKVEASAGQAVKAGDAIIILEAMKMEIPVVAPQDGTIASIDVSVGDAIESGDILASMN